MAKVHLSGITIYGSALCFTSNIRIGCKRLGRAKHELSLFIQRIGDEGKMFYNIDASNDGKGREQGPYSQHFIFS
jgi:hypothetical protein